jgi:hypothetical protein
MLMKICVQIFSMVIFLGFLLGCQTGSRTSSPVESSEGPQEASTALKSMVSSVSGQDVNEEDLRDLVRDVSRNAETQSAVQEISDAMTGEGAIIKYCPVDGKRYSSRFAVCPEHNVALKELEE